MDTGGSMVFALVLAIPVRDRVTFLSSATIHRVHALCTEPRKWNAAICDAIDRDRDFVVRSVHHHHYHYHHRCRNGSRAMASAITWPRCAFAWKSESLNKLPASVRAI